MRMILRAILPGLIILRLADTKRAGMDKLYYYVRRMDLTIEKSKQMLDNVEKNYDNEDTNADVPTRMIQYFLNSEGAELEDPEDSSLSDNDEDAGELVDDMIASDDDDDGDAIDLQASLGSRMLMAWEKRRKNLVTDFSVTGWMLCPMEEVMDDVKENHNGEDRNAVERVIIKLFGQDKEKDERMQMLNTFWTEFYDFQTKSGPYANREHIWLSKDLMDGVSHIWHNKNTLRYTTILGKLACRVCSKILGIGSAERNWGDVKHLKTNKRSHLSADSVKKQATIFGAYCAEKADIERRKFDNDATPYKFWTDNDFDKALGLDILAGEAAERIQVKPSRIVKCYMEDWEVGAQKKKDPVNEARLMKKYENLEWFDPDTNKMFRVDGMNWKGGRGKDSGYSVSAYNEDWEIDDPKHEENEEPWAIFKNCVLHECIMDYYKKHPEFGVRAIGEEQLFSTSDEEAEGE
jgi:hypothetical protein